MRQNLAFEAVCPLPRREAALRASVIARSLPGGEGGAEPRKAGGFGKMSILSFSVVDSEMGCPYNPPIAEAAARKRGDDRSKPLKSKSNFRFQVFEFR